MPDIYVVDGVISNAIFGALVVIALVSLARSRGGRNG